MTSSFPPSKEMAGHIAQWLAIAAILAGIVARFVAIEEAKENLVSAVADQKTRADKIEERVRDIETSRTLEIQINALTAEVVALKVQVSGLREELRAKRR
ncbi:MAG TPA: hypothetical protein VHM19_14055 [Polyangiales bacterium]|nr:hypothetical protein [Polyangiales bacterium]